MSASTSVGVPAALGLLTLTEAAVPVPIPADVLMLLVGERAAAGAVPVWLAVLGLEAAAVIGTTVVFFALRGPARALVHRLGPRVGLSTERLTRATTLVEQRGRNTIALGRATPGLRTITMVAAATAGVAARRALPALWIGSSLFVQVHFVVGYVAGPAARDLLEAAAPLFIALVVLALAVALVLWIRRRGRRRGITAWVEAACPACLVFGAAGAKRVLDVS
jgi:membrane protein DedA with SNARE-associated domain